MRPAEVGHAGGVTIVVRRATDDDVVELARATCRSLRGAAHTVEQLAGGMPSNYHRDFQLLKKPLLGALGDGWLLTVEDDGAGVPPELRTAILEPFFTTRPTGTGLGLASVVACARYHGGGVTVDASRWGGARFAVTFAAV